MKISIKKISSFLLLIVIILTNLGTINTYANKNNTEKTKKEFDLKQKYKGEKLKKIKDSIAGKDNYKVVIKSNKTINELKDYYKGIDINIKIKNIGEGIFQIKIPKNSGIASDFKNIEDGMLPETIGGEAVVRPEIFETFDNGYLSGEENQNLWYMEKLKANTFQEELQTKEKIKIGVLDTGVDYNNEDLRDNYDNILSYNFTNETSSPIDDNGHGTQVSGIIGAKVNGKGIFGVNSHADIVSLKVLDKDGLGTSYDVLEAINYAANNGIKVINMSFGGIGDPNTSEICKAITSAKDKGIVTVVSAGNNNTDVSNIVPAGCSDAITVGSVDKEDNKVDFSNYGTGVDIYAPGKDIYTTSLNNSYLHVSGTSFSTALVSGLITKELAYDQTMSYDTLVNNIHKNYNLISSIYNQPTVTASGSTSGTGEAMTYTGGELAETLIEEGKFRMDGDLYPLFGNNGVWNCNRVETATFSNGYSLKHYTLSIDHTRYVGRTELYFNGVLKEYQDNVFFSISGAPYFGGSSCYLTSKFRSVIFRENGIIDIDYYFWAGYGWQYGVVPTKFNINKKNVSNLTITNSVFGYDPHFFIKLNILDNSISDTINIASQGIFDYTWSSEHAYGDGSGWLFGSMWFWSNGCTITNVRDSEMNYLVDYTCLLNMERSGSAVYGPGRSWVEQSIGTFNLSKNDYDLCSYDKKFCSLPKFSLLSSTPSNESTGIVTNTFISLNFSQPIDKTTVPGNIILKKTDGSIVNTWAVDYSDTVVTFRAMAPLNKNTTYIVELKTGLKDIGGNNLGNDSSFSFTTGSEPAQPGQGGTIASTALSPACLLAGYSLAHPECIILNALIFDNNTQVVLNGSEGGSPAGDPVSLPTGEFTYSNTLMHIPGDGLDYDFSLAYKSQAYSNGPVGISWDHSYNIFLRENIDGSVTYADGKFGVYTFAKDADGNFSRLPGIEADLVKTDTSYELRFTNGTTDIFNADLRIASIRDKDNHALTFTYTGDKLASTTDTLGRTITYDYYDHGRLKGITDFSGRTVTLAYYSETDEGGSAYDLKSIMINNGVDPRTISFTYQKDATSEILSHNILTLTDSKGNEYVKNTYDVDDRVVSQKYGDGTLKYVYETDPNNPKHITKTTVTNKRGMKSEFVYDENGNTLSKTLFNGDIPITTTYTYATNGKIATETKSLGNGVSYQYDAQNRLTEKREKANMTQPDNDSGDLVTKYEYTTTFSIPTKITDPNGTIITTVLDTKGNITETKVIGVKKADGSTYDVTSTFTYDTDGHLITKTDGVGNQTKYEYSDGRVTKVIEGNGDEATTTLFSYDTHGNLTETTDGEGNIKKFTFDQYDRLTSSLSAEGILQSIEYDANNNKTAQKVDLENGKTLKSTSVYDILDQVVENAIGSNSDDQRVTKIVRDANGNVTETTDARGFKTKYIYNLLDQIIEKHIIIPSVAEGSLDVVTKYTYDKNGNITQITDPKGNKTTYAYDGFGRVITTTDTNNTVTKYGYDKTGNITATSITDQSGTVLVKGATTFNSLGKALTQTVTDPKTNTNKTTTYTYDQNGNVLSKTDPKGNTTQYVYNSYNNIQETIDPVGNKVKLTYDKRGLVVSKAIVGTNSVSLTTSYVYDRDGRLIKETNNQQQSKAYTYNKQNKIIQTVDEAGNKTDYTYDVFGNVLNETKYIGGKSLTTTYIYDASNNLTSVTDANGNKTAYEYNLLNQRVKEVLPDGSTTSYMYDANNNLASYTDPNGTVVNNTYNTLNRLTHRAIQPGTGVIGVTSEDYAYDTLGRLTSGNDSQNNAVAFQYDVFNNLTSETNNGKAVGYGYDANANLTSLLYPSGKKLDRAYDALNRIIGISLDDKNIASYGYNSLTLDTFTLANGAKTTYGYDALLRLKELTNIGKEEMRKGKDTTTQDSIINKFSFSYDAISNILSNGHDNYSYDSLNRLTQTQYEPVQDKKNTTESFMYDPMGNRLTSLVAETKENEKEKNKKDDKTKTDTTSYTSNILNQYTGVDKTKLTYDKNGNLVNNGKFRFAYDYRNRLIKVTSKDGEIKAEFSYDVLGRRLTKTIYEDEDEIKKTIKYIYSNNDAIEENEYRYDDGKEKLKNVKEYIYGKGVDDVLVMILTTTDGKKKVENQYFYQKNQLGSITDITNKDGKVVEEYRYDAFGKAYIREGKSDNWREFKESKIGNTRLFTGREYDKEIGLYYYRARYYSAELGRFINRDPIGMSDDINLYNYVGNNPVKFIDAMGREKVMIAGLTSADRFNMMSDFLQSEIYHNSLNSGNTSAIDALWTYASYLSNDNVNTALFTIIETVQLFSNIYNESNADFIVREQNLPSGLTGDYSTAFGDTDKLQHFFVSALISYNTSLGISDVNIGGFVVGALGTLHELSDELWSHILTDNNGGFSVEDIAANTMGAEFGRNLSLNSEIYRQMPSYFINN